MKRMSRIHPIACASVALLLSIPCAAAEDPAPPPAVEETATPAFKPSFVIHGYLTAAYGKTSEGQALGISDEGTTDYMRAALQLRFEMAPKDSAVIQLRHIQIGNSPSAQFKQEVEVGWAYYEHRFSERLRLRAGRTPLPYAFDNEFQSAGIVLPFYRLPPSLYSPDTNNHETLDGGSLFYEQPIHGDWSAGVDLYGGSVTSGNENINTGTSYVANKVTAPNLRGARILVHNSDDTVQAYVSGMRYRRDHSAINGFQPTQAEVVTEGIRLRHGAFDFQAEHLRAPFHGPLLGYTFHGAYAQLGYAATERWGIHALAERLRIDFGGIREGGDYYDSLGGSVTYRVSNHAVLKVEEQRLRTYGNDSPVRNIVTDPQFHTTLFIASVSVAF
jgi:hypothetical protein